jgi:hypothetical protein
VVVRLDGILVGDRPGVVNASSLIASVRNGPQLVVKASFHLYAVERAFCLRNNRVHNFVTSNLRRQKHGPFRKIKVGEFDDPVARNHREPFISHGASVDT